VLADGLREPGRPGTHCMQPVAWVGRWKFLKGWTKVWSCDRHADELPWARRLTMTQPLRSRHLDDRNRVCG
jgi:hypothetical protein